MRIKWYINELTLNFQTLEKKDCPHRSAKLFNIRLRRASPHSPGAITTRASCSCKPFSLLSVLTWNPRFSLAGNVCGSECQYCLTIQLYQSRTRSEQTRHCNVKELLPERIITTRATGWTMITSSIATARSTTVGELSLQTIRHKQVNIIYRQSPVYDSINEFFVWISTIWSTVSISSGSFITVTMWYYKVR